MSLKIEDYLNSISTLATSTVQSATASQNTVETESSDRDSYVASAVDSTEAIPSETYNDILQVIRNAQAESSSSGTSTSSDTSEEAVSGTSGGGGGGGDSDSEEETTTEVVTIDGVTYLETTTTTDGVTTVTRTVLSSDNSGSQDAGKADNRIADNEKN